MSEENFVGEVVDKLKKQGLFDRFRKECLSDVDTKPAYQNLQVRVKEAVSKYLHGVKWKSDLNKNQLRENLRRHLNDLPMLTNGIDRVVDQVVKPKILKSLKPQIDQVVCEHMGLNYEQWLRDQNDVQKKLEQHTPAPLSFPHPPLAIPLTTSTPIVTTSAPHLSSSSSSSFPLTINDLKIPPPPPPVSNSLAEPELKATPMENITSFQSATDTTLVMSILSPTISNGPPVVPFLHPDTSVPPPSLTSVMPSRSLVPAVLPVVPDVLSVTPALLPGVPALQSVVPNVPTMTPTLPLCAPALPPAILPVTPSLPLCVPAPPPAMLPVTPALPPSPAGTPALPPSAPLPPPDIPAPPPDPDFTQSLSPPPLPPDEEENIEADFDAYQQEAGSDHRHEPETCEMPNEKEVAVFEEVTADDSNFFHFQENQISEEVTSFETKPAVSGRNLELNNEKSNRSLFDTSRDTDDKSFDGNFNFSASHEGMSERYNFAWNEVNESDLSNITVSSVHTSDLSSFEGEEDDDHDDGDGMKKQNQEGYNRVAIEELKDEKQENEIDNQGADDSSSTEKKMTLASIKSAAQSNSMMNPCKPSKGKKKMKKEEMKERKMVEKRRRTLNRKYCSDEFTSIFTTKRNLLESKEVKKATVVETQAAIEETSVSIMGSEDDSKQQMEVANDDSEDENVKSPYSDISEASSDSVVVVGVEPAKRKKTNSSKSKKSKSRKRSRSSDRDGGSGRKKKKSKRHRSGRRSSRHRSGRDSDEDGSGADDFPVEKDVYRLPVNSEGGEGSGGTSVSSSRKRSSRHKSSSSKSRDHDDFSRSSVNDEKMVNDDDYNNSGGDDVGEDGCYDGGDSSPEESTTRRKLRKSVDEINFGEAARHAAAFRMTGSSKQPAANVATWQKQQQYSQVQRQTLPHSQHYLPASNFLPPPALAGHRQVPSSFPPIPVVRPPYHHQGRLMTRPSRDSRRFSHVRNNEGQGYIEDKYSADARVKYHGSRVSSRSVHSANLGRRNDDELMKNESVNDGENRGKRRWVASDQPGDTSGSSADVSKISRQQKNFRHDRSLHESVFIGGPSYRTNSGDESLERSRSNTNRVEHERFSNSRRIRK